MLSFLQLASWMCKSVAEPIKRALPATKLLVAARSVKLAAPILSAARILFVQCFQRSVLRGF